MYVGCVYVYKSIKGSLSLAQTLFPSQSSSGMLFGWAVETSDTVIAVTAYHESEPDVESSTGTVSLYVIQYYQCVLKYHYNKLN